MWNLIESITDTANIGIIPNPSFSESNAFPITEPNALYGWSAFIACPFVDEVVNKSPL